MSFNLKTKALNDTAVVTLMNPDDSGVALVDPETGLDCTITIFGRTSKEYRVWAATAARKSEKQGKKKLSIDEVAENTADFLTAITKSVSGIDLDGEVLDNPASIKKMYMLPELEWIGGQVVAVLGDQADFLAQ